MSKISTTTLNPQKIAQAEPDELAQLYQEQEAKVAEAAKEMVAPGVDESVAIGQALAGTAPPASRNKAQQLRQLYQDLEALRALYSARTHFKLPGLGVDPVQRICESIADRALKARVVEAGPGALPDHIADLVQGSARQDAAEVAAAFVASPLYTNTDQDADYLRALLASDRDGTALTALLDPTTARGRAWLRLVHEQGPTAFDPARGDDATRQALADEFRRQVLHMTWPRERELDPLHTASVQGLQDILRADQGHGNRPPLVAYLDGEATPYLAWSADGAVKMMLDTSVPLEERLETLDLAARLCNAKLAIEQNRGSDRDTAIVQATDFAEALDGLLATPRPHDRVVEAAAALIGEAQDWIEFYQASTALFRQPSDWPLRAELPKSTPFALKVHGPENPRGIIPAADFAREQRVRNDIASELEARLGYCLDATQRADLTVYASGSRGA